MYLERTFKPISTYPTPLSFLERVEAVVIENLSNESFCMADLAQNLLMCNSQVYRKIKKQTGYSPSVYVRNIRLKEAKVLMKKSDMTLSEISYKVGFNGLSYFSRCFTKQYGMAPSIFRAAFIESIYA